MRSARCCTTTSAAAINRRLSTNASREVCWLDIGGELSDEIGQLQCILTVRLGIYITFLWHSGQKDSCIFMTDLIYISGSGRSGSTLLERVLHSSNNVFALGEFHCLWRLALEHINCSCGARFTDDPFWREVMERAQFGHPEFSRLRQLEAQVARSGLLLRSGFSLARLREDPAVGEFVAMQQHLFAAIRAVSGKPILIDSSKAGPRAWLLATDPGTSVIHLYREPGDVIASWQSAKFDPGLGDAMQRLGIADAARDWWKVEQLARLLARRRPVFQLDYAKLCAAPREAIAALAAHCGLSSSLVPQWLGPDRFAQGDGYHSLNGNPDRFDRGPVRIASRPASRDSLPSRTRQQIGIVAAMLRAAYPAPATAAIPSDTCRQAGSELQH